MTLKTWRTQLARQVGVDIDNITPRVSDALDEYIQNALRDIYSYHRWEFLEETYRYRLYAAASDGTVAVTAAGTVWTGTDTGWDTGMSGGTVKIRSDGEVYRITTVDTSTQATATDAALRTLSAEDYVLYMDEVNLAAAIESIEAMWVATEDKRVLPIPQASMADHKSRGFYSGHPQYFAPKGRDSSGYPRIELYPIPAYDEILHVQAYKAGTVPTSDGGTSDIPDRFQNVVLARAKMYLHESPTGKPELYSPAASEYARLQMMMVQQACINQGPMTLKLDPAVHGPEPLSLDVTKASIV